MLPALRRLFKAPSRKQLSPIIPIPTEAIRKILPEYHNKQYSKKRTCPKYASENVVKRSIESRIFCTLITENGYEDIKVEIKRLQCKKCTPSSTQATFYDNRINGAPISDLYLAFAANTPHNWEKASLTDLGIQVD